MSDVRLGDIPVGDIQLYDHYVPGLAGDTSYFLDVSHAVYDGGTQLNDATLAASQEVVLGAPQFSIDTTELLSYFPPAGSTAPYGEVLPHVVLSEPMLPWERNLGTQEAPQPWLALLVFGAEELPRAGATGTGTVATTVGEFLEPPPAHATIVGTMLKPAVTKSDDIADDAPMAYVELPTGLFQAITPRVDELRFLTHCRRVNTGDKAILGMNEDGLFSVVVANRFPEPPANGTAVRNIVHLVSLEGLEAYLVDSPPFQGETSVAVVSLASWSFSCQADSPEDFPGLVGGLVRSGTGPLTVSSTGVDTSTAEGKEAARRLDAGFVPLPYRTRTGEGTIAWYRGPFVPQPTTALTKSVPFATADAAAIYDKGHGVFDQSLAAAFELGRAAALADKAFGQRLLDLRLRAHRFTDTLLDRLEGDHFSATDIASLSGASVQDELRALLHTDVLRDLGQNPTPPAPPPAPAPGPDESPRDALARLMAQDDTQQALAQAVTVDLDPVATWLGRLLLLYQVPFTHLVPDQAMLPPESLRFFYVDRNWLDAMLDGAVSIGMQSSRDTFLQQIIGDVVNTAAYDFLETVRENLPGSGPAPPSAGADAMTGLLLRSDLVSGWPNLGVRACNGVARGAELMKTLRMDHLAPGVLLCLFSGVPARVELAEPQESFRFGIEADGKAQLRQVSGADLGEPTEQYTIVPTFLRDDAHRVLAITPSAPGGLVQTLAGQVGASVADFGPADFALQMVSAPESVAFCTSGGGT